MGGEGRSRLEAYRSGFLCHISYFCSGNKSQISHLPLPLRLSSLVFPEVSEFFSAYLDMGFTFCLIFFGLELSRLFSFHLSMCRIFILRSKRCVNKTTSVGINTEPIPIHGELLSEYEA